MGFRGVDLEEGWDDKPARVRSRDITTWRAFSSWRRDFTPWRRDVSWGRLAILLLYLAALVGAGAFLARRVSGQAGAGVVVGGLILLVVLALRSRNRAGDSGLDWTSGGAYEGGWDVGVGGDGGGGGGD